MRAKTLLLASVLALGAASAHAQGGRVNVSGPYAALGIGTGVTQHQTDVGGLGSASLGWGFGNGLRLELQGSRMEASSGRTGGDVQQTGAFANAFYDIDASGLAARVGAPDLGLVPYVGLGAGYQWLERSGDRREAGSDGGFSLQGMVGASYGVAAVPGLSVTGEYRVTGVPGDLLVRGERADGAVTHAGLLGVRYAFGAPSPSLLAIGHQSAAPQPMPAVSPARTYLVFFDWDKADLTARARQIVGEAAQKAKAEQPARVEVAGHADRSGAPQYNMALSRRRADTVAAELVRGGVAKESIVVTAFGETRPLVPTADGAREVQNRRVEIVIR